MATATCEDTALIRTFEESSPREKMDEERWLCGKQVNSQIQDLELVEEL